MNVRNSQDSEFLLQRITSLKPFQSLANPLFSEYVFVYAIHWEIHCFTWFFFGIYYLTVHCQLLRKLELQLNHCRVAWVPSSPVSHYTLAAWMLSIFHSTSSFSEQQCSGSWAFRHMSTVPHSNLEQSSWEPGKLPSSWTGRQSKSFIGPFSLLKNFTILAKFGIERKLLEKALIQVRVPDTDQGSHFTPFISRLRDVPPKADLTSGSECPAASASGPPSCSGSWGCPRLSKAPLSHDELEEPNVPSWAGTMSWYKYLTIL